MKYKALGSAPGSLLPKNAQNNLMRNPGKVQDYDLAESFLVRENAMVLDLINYFLKNPTLQKAEEYWTYFQSQWKQNIINYIKHTNATTTVSDVEVNHYKSHYKFRQAILMVNEYVERTREKQRIIDRFPHVGTENNKTIFGLQKMIDSNHSRLMVFRKDIMANSSNPEATTVKR